jgi:hypothetical protein
MKTTYIQPACLGVRTVCARRSATTILPSLFLAFAPLLLAACGFPGPALLRDDTPGDAGSTPGSDSSGGPDAAGSSGDSGGSTTPPAPGTTIHVSPTGSDANDGLLLPVKTLQHAVGLAAADPTLTAIALAAGRYSASTGETFPYSIPLHLEVLGPVGGGAVLVGDAVQPGLTLRDGSLRDLEFENFGIAVDSTGATKLTNARIRSTTTGVRGHGQASLTINNLDITGIAGACATGIRLDETAHLDLTGLSARGLGATVDAEDHSSANLTGMNVTGDLGCSNAVINAASDGTFAITESVLDTGNVGIELGLQTASRQAQASVTNVTIHHMKGVGMGFGNANVVVVGGELSHNGMVATVVSAFEVTLSLTNVLIDQNPGGALEVERTALTMRRCTVTGNGAGMAVEVMVIDLVDLGTSTSPGENVFQNNSAYGLRIQGSDFGPVRTVHAVGNTWNFMVEGTDGSGNYNPSRTALGTDPITQGPNYDLFGRMLSLEL